MSGFGKLESIDLCPDWLQASDKQVVEGLIATAVNECLEKVKSNLKTEAESLARDSGISGI